MKVLALVIFSVAAVSGFGSGPYLPSGWRPQGPAFYLPSEVQKPAENPLKDTILQESEASGSDALREYGPPKVAEVSQDLTSQALPDTVTEQAFVVIEAKFTEEVNGVKEVSQVKAIEEINAGVTEEVDDSNVTSEEKTTEEAVTKAAETTPAVESEVQGKSVEIDESTELNDATEANEATKANEATEANETTEANEATTESIKTFTAGESPVEDSVAVRAEADSNVESTQVEQVNQVQEVEERTVGVNNVVDALANLDKEIKAQAQNSEDTVEVKSVQVLGQETPEGFLEYGPPGFREYGPPQADELARSAAIQQTEEEQKIESNETRRRRFSPKFRSSKKH